MKKIVSIGIACGIVLGIIYIFMKQENKIVTNNIATPIIKPTQQTQEKKRKIYALGDSLTAGYQLPLEESYPLQLASLLGNAGYDYTIVNAGKSGDTSAGMLARIDRVTEEAQPGDLALLVIGANDGLQSLPLDQLTDNMHSIIAILQAKQIDIIIGGMELPTNLDPIYREQFSALYSNISEEYGLPLIPFFLEDVATIPALNLADGIHPNKEGYAIIANNMLTFLQQEELISK